MPHFKLGEFVAWTLFDGNIMAGEIVAMPSYCGSAYRVRRVDGCDCTIEPARLHRASIDERLEACRFYSTASYREPDSFGPLAGARPAQAPGDCQASS